jgi:N-acetylglucosaminyl-diphospho-decaprenol L-rhamnosyltransferase
VPVLSAAIVVYRTPPELAAAIASLRSQTEPPKEIVVIDNGAGDGFPLPVLPDLEGVRVERPGTNIGFGAGCNRAVKSAASEHVLVMNADVVLSAEALVAMANRMRADPSIGVVGPRIFSGGRLQHSARAFPTMWTGLFGRRSALTRILTLTQHYPAELRPTYGSGGVVDWVSGACMLVHREAFEAVGGFDEGYWMYWEDGDLCVRLAKAGWSVYYEPGAVVHHATGASGTTERTVRAFHDSAARFADRHVATGRGSRIAVRWLLRMRAWTIVHYGRRIARTRT